MALCSRTQCGRISDMGCFFCFVFLIPQIQEYQTTQTERKLNVWLLYELLGKRVCVTVMEPIESFKSTQIDWMMRTAFYWDTDATAALQCRIKKKKKDPIFIRYKYCRMSPCCFPLCSSLESVSGWG